MEVASNPLETRVLLLVPTAKDAEVTRSLLGYAGLKSVICANIPSLNCEIKQGAGAVLLTEEIFTDERIAELLDLLRSQPPWSELPIVVLMRGGAESLAATRVLCSLGNVTLLEKPAPMRSVVSAVKAAVRGRQRQYQIRDQLEEIRRGEEHRQQLLESERTARADAERANRMKDEFLAALSHELRTPLNTISMSVQFLKSAKFSPQDLDEMLWNISNAVRNQTQLISDLLDVSRIISGKLAFDRQWIDMAQIVGSAVNNLAALARDKRIDVVCRYSHQPLRMFGDSTRLQQVVWNLLSNAIKFTPSGGRVKINVQRLDSTIELTVSDNGCGIEPSFLPHVFERFRQADSSSTRKHGGLGLGLSIVKQIVELHNGTIQAESAGLNRGATFRMILPSAENSTFHSPFDSKSDELNGLRVMIVDDDQEACSLLRRLLENSKAEVLCVYSATEALEQVDRFGPQFLLSDIGMPGMDGHALIRELRARGKGPSELPAAALTAFAGPEDRERALLAGFQSHITKPINGSELIAQIASLSRRTGA